jgi:hypothetical protein
MKNKGGGGVRTRSSYKKQKAGTGDGGEPPIFNFATPSSFFSDLYTSAYNNALLKQGTSCPDPDNPFEEEFGSSSDSGQGVWVELSEGVASNLANTVVSIASFDEGDYTQSALDIYFHLIHCR